MVSKYSDCALLTGFSLKFQENSVCRQIWDTGIRKKNLLQPKLPAGQHLPFSKLIFGIGALLSWNIVKIGTMYYFFFGGGWISDKLFKTKDRCQRGDFGHFVPDEQEGATANELRAIYDNCPAFISLLSKSYTLEFQGLLQRIFAADCTKHGVTRMFYSDIFNHWQDEICRHKWKRGQKLFYDIVIRAGNSRSFKWVTLWWFLFGMHPYQPTLDFALF